MYCGVRLLLLYSFVQVSRNNSTPSACFRCKCTHADCFVQLWLISCQRGAAEGWLSFRQPTKARGQPAQTYLLCNSVVLYRYTLILRSPNRHSQWLSNSVCVYVCVFVLFLMRCAWFGGLIPHTGHDLCRSQYIITAFDISK